MRRTLAAAAALYKSFPRVLPNLRFKRKTDVNDPRGQKSSSASLTEPGRYAAPPVKTERRRAAAAAAAARCLSVLPQFYCICDMKAPPKNKEHRFPRDITG